MFIYEWLTTKEFEIGAGFTKRGDTRSLLSDQLLPQLLINSFDVFISPLHGVFSTCWPHICGSLVSHLASHKDEDAGGSALGIPGHGPVPTESGRQPLEGTRHLAGFRACFRRKMGFTSWIPPVI